MAIAADFLTAPKFEKATSSFLAGKLMGAGVSALVSKPLTNLTAKNTINDQVETAQQLVKPRVKSALEAAPTAYKLDDSVLSELRSRASYDEDAIISKYIPGWNKSSAESMLEQLRAKAAELGVSLDEQFADYNDMIGSLTPAKPGSYSDMYTFMALKNKLPTITFYKPASGVSGKPGTTGTGTMGLQAGFSDRLLALISEVKRRGHTVRIGQGWRSYAEQVDLKRRKPQLAATPGKSNHGWGLAADLEFSSPQARKLAHDLAPLYGLRFPMSYEPWHIEPAVIKRVSGGKVYSDKFSIVDIYQRYQRLSRTAK